jgi:hypothetical protein
VTSRRVHEWAWGDIGTRTVCGLTRELYRASVVSNLGLVDPEQRCRNCERMREAIGVSSRPVPHDLPDRDGMIEVARAAAPASDNPLGVNDRELGILEHATGWRSRWPLYRNHFCAGPSHDDWATIQDLVARGLMNVSRKPSGLSGGDTVFCVSAIGIAALRAKRRRHEARATPESAE